MNLKCNVKQIWQYRPKRKAESLATSKLICIYARKKSNCVNLAIIGELKKGDTKGMDTNQEVV